MRRLFFLLVWFASLATAPPVFGQSLQAATSTVVDAIVSAASENHQRAHPLQGDLLTEHLMRRAAQAASRLPEAVSVKAYLLALGIALDDAGTLQRTPLLSQWVPVVESESQRRQRRSVLGKPTMRGRHDTAQHFVVSAALVPLVGSEVAQSAGILKEIRDAQGGSGFSFADLSADLAGIAFARHLLSTAPPIRVEQQPPSLAAPASTSDTRLSLADVAETFTIERFMPDQCNLPEGLSWKAFLDHYGSTTDPRFQRQVEAIQKRIRALPGYCRLTPPADG